MLLKFVYNAIEIRWDDLNRRLWRIVVGEKKYIKLCKTSPAYALKGLTCCDQLGEAQTLIKQKRHQPIGGKGQIGTSSLFKPLGGEEALRWGTGGVD